MITKTTREGRNDKTRNTRLKLRTRWGARIGVVKVLEKNMYPGHVSPSCRKQGQAHSVKVFLLKHGSSFNSKTYSLGAWTNTSINVQIHAFIKKVQNSISKTITLLYHTMMRSHVFLWNSHGERLSVVKLTYDRPQRLYGNRKIYFSGSF